MPVAGWTMAYGGPNHTDHVADMTDLSTAGNGIMPVNSAHEEAGAALAFDLVQQLGQVRLEPSPALAAKSSKYTRKYSLRELEIQQTIGRQVG